MALGVYFAKDGNYGEAEDLLILDEEDVKDWTEEMWYTIENARDNERITIAHRFYHGYTVEQVQDLF